MNHLRNLRPDEIATLRSQACRADDWNQVWVPEVFDIEYVNHVRFSGVVKLGAFRKAFTLPGGLVKHSGLRHVTLHNCTLGDNVLIENVQNYIANYQIGDDCFIQNINVMLVEGKATFGNNVEVSVLNETGGREVPIYDGLSASLAYIIALYRHRPALIERLRDMITAYTEGIASTEGTVGDKVKIVNTGTIRNVKIGDYATIENSARLENGSVNSKREAPVFIGDSVIAQDFIVSSGAKIADAAKIIRCFIGQACQVTHNFSAHDSLLFSNCAFENGAARIGAFSLVMGRHHHHSDTSDIPFSYLIEKDDETYLVPGINLRSVGTIRDAQKWPKRDKRTDPDRLDMINYNLLSPYTIQKMLKAVDILKNLQALVGETSEIYYYQNTRIKGSSLRNALNFYGMAINKFFGNSLIKRLEGTTYCSMEEVWEQLRPTESKGSGEWLDLAGLILPREPLEALLQDIEQGEIASLEDVECFFRLVHGRYYSLEWTWAYEMIERYYGVDLRSISAAEIIDLVRRWQECVIRLDEMLYEDARKEFSLTSMIGFGVDGSSKEKQQDFEGVRGDFMNNPFVTAVQEHIVNKRALGDELIERLKPLV